MDGDEVGALQKIVERHQLDVEELGALDCDHGVVRDDVHLESVCALRDLRPDVAEADDAQRLAAHLDAEKFGAGPVAGVDRGVCLRDPARHREQQGDCVLRGGDDVAARGVDDQDAVARRGGDVDVVDADSRATHNPQAFAGLEDRRRHLRLAAHDQRVVVRNALHQLRLGELGRDRHLAFAAKPCEAVLSQGISDQDPGHES